MMLMQKKRLFNYLPVNEFLLFFCYYFSKKKKTSNRNVLKDKFFIYEKIIFCNNRLQVRVMFCYSTAILSGFDRLCQVHR